MHVTAWFFGWGLTLLLLGGVGCATKGGDPSRSAEAVPAQGHWVTLPPETGSRIPRKMWMNEDGTLSARPGGAQVESYDGAVFQQWQQRGAFHGRTGN
jgi:hypothetical protein